MPRLTIMKLETFDFNTLPVRVMTREGQTWFVASDVCRVLDLTNVTEATRQLDADELDSEILNSGDQGRKTIIISESGLYTLIFKSRKPEAKKFRKWVTCEVLPAIRRTGSYALPVDGVEVVSLLRYVREVCADWSLERQMDFGHTARRYAKSMGIVFQTGEEPGFGRVFVFPREMLHDLRGQMTRANGLPNGEAVEFERLLAVIHEKHGDCTLDAETVRGMAKTMRLFKRIFHEHASAASEHSAFGSLVRRYEGRCFPTGLVVHSHARKGRRQYEVLRSRVMQAVLN